MRLQVIPVLLCFLFSAPTQAAEQRPVFGPQKYDVVERYGKENRYTVSFSSSEGSYLVQLKNGENPAQRTDFIKFSVNGEVLLQEGAYDYPYLACFVKLKEHNTFELVLRDYQPTGFRRPPATPKNVTLTIMPTSVKLPTLAIGIAAWERLQDYTEPLLKIKSSPSLPLVVSAATLGNGTEVRADAMRKLADRKDPATEEFILHVFGDYAEPPEIRAESAFALGMLGNKAAVPSLIGGLLDPEDKVRISSARALSRYPEEDTRVPFSQALESMDVMMKSAVVKATAAAGWRPVGTLIGLADSPDPATANLGVEMLGGAREDRVFELLLKYLENPGHRDVKVIITAIGQTKNSKATASLSRIARDPVRRKGAEAELGAALADLGDPGSAVLIAAMIKQAESREVYFHLLAAYKKLTGRDYLNEKKE